MVGISRQLTHFSFVGKRLFVILNFHMGETRKYLAENLRLLRKINSITQSVLAEKANTSTNTISDIERERTWPTDETFEKIASVFSLKVHELLLEPDVLKKNLESRSMKAEDSIKKYIDLLLEVQEAAREIPPPLIQKLRYNISHMK